MTPATIQILGAVQKSLQDAVKTYKRNADTARAAVLLEAAYRISDMSSGPYQTVTTRESLLAAANAILLDDQ